MSKWTERQIEILKDNYHKYSKPDISKMVEHSIGATESMACRLKIGRIHYKDPLDSFITRVAISYNEYNGTPCWEWIGNRHKDGYGVFDTNNQRIRPHRWAYEYFIKQIPSNLEPDHLCRSRSCVNPLHIELVTHKENVLRGNSPFAINARKRINGVSAT